MITRNPVSQKTLISLIEKSKNPVFDLNIRQPFVDSELILKLVSKSRIIKLNKEELSSLCDWANIIGEIPESLPKIGEKFNLDKIIVTLGADGASLWSINSNQILSVPSESIKLVNTVGSGDSFIATFLHQTLAGKSDLEALKSSVKIAGQVAEFDSATPNIVYNDFL